LLTIDWSDLKELAYSHTPKEIAKIKGCSYNRTRRVMEKQGIARPGLYSSPAKLDKIRQLYSSHSSYQIAAILKMPVATVKKYIKRLGISRGQSEAMKLAYHKIDNCPHQFTIRVSGGYTCLTCKRHFKFSS